MKIIAKLAIAFCLTQCIISPAVACPLCSDAIANSNSSASEDDTDQFPAAMNQSIYLMLSAAYMTFGVVGFMIYRGVRQNSAYLEKVREIDIATENLTTDTSR